MGEVVPEVDVETVTATVVGLRQERDRGVQRATGLLAVVASLVVAVLILTGAATQAIWIFAATPLIMGMSHYVARAGYTLPAAAASITGACAGAVVIGQWAPAWTPLASLFLMLTAVMILASQIMTFEVATGLGVANVVIASFIPTFLPVAATGFVQIPYLFIFLNAIFILFAGLLRSQDKEQMVQLQEETHRLEAAFAAAEKEAERKRQEQARHMRRVEAMARKQRAMLDAASHEIRTPLTPLLMQVAAFKRKNVLTADQARSIEALERNLKRMASLVGDLLDLARMDNDRMELARSATPVLTLLEDVKATFEMQAAEKLVVIDIESPDTIVHVDATRIAQVVNNLVSNAIKYAPQGSHVTIKAREAHGGIEVTVTDTGIGLTNHQREALFQPFSQVHPSDTRTGTGLGLYISRGIVSQHDGRIWVESEGRGKGTTVGFWVPTPILGPDALVDIVN